MTRIIKPALAAVLAAMPAPSVASAHAFLEHAVPGVGSTVSGAPSELELSFTEGVVPSLSGVRLTSAGGGAVATGKIMVDAGNPAVVHVRLGRALAPGGYVVHWHVVATDTHPTSGTYKFTVTP